MTLFVAVVDPATILSNWLIFQLTKWLKELRECTGFHRAATKQNIDKDRANKTRSVCIERYRVEKSNIEAIKWAIEWNENVNKKG